MFFYEIEAFFIRKKYNNINLAKKHLIIKHKQGTARPLPATRSAISYIYPIYILYRSYILI